MTKTEFHKTLAWLAILGAGVILVALVYLAFRYWTWVTTLSPVTLAAWATIATMVFPLLFGLGFYFGKVEAKGWLHGADQLLERGWSTMEKVTSIRDTSRINVHNATKPQPAQPAIQGPYLPDPDFPRFTVRTGSEEIIDV
jgi:hypothetical protein